MTTKSTVITVSTETADATNALVVKITEANLVPANDVQVLADVVENHKAQLHRVLALIEEFDLSARAVAVIYETRDSFGDSAAPSLAALARTTAAFPELASGDSDDIATELQEACYQAYQRWPTWTLYPDTILKSLIAVGAEDTMSFSQAVDFFINSPVIGLDEDGEVVFYGG